MSRAKFLKHIKSLTEEDLRAEVELLYNKLPGVKDHYKMDLGDAKDRSKIFTKAKVEIEKKFATRSRRRPRRPRIQKTYTVLRALEKKSIFDYEMIDPFLFTTETALDFAKRYYFESPALDNLVNSCLEKATNLIMLNNMEKEFKPRITIILDNHQRQLSHPAKLILANLHK